MKILFPEFVFPTDGWKHSGSSSYGLDELFHGIPHVLVRLFPEAEQAIAYGTHFFLKECGVTSASLDKITHHDGTTYYYVWGQMDQVLKQTEQIVPNLIVEGKLG